MKRKQLLSLVARSLKCNLQAMVTHLCCTGQKIFEIYFENSTGNKWPKSHLLLLPPALFLSSCSCTYMQCWLYVWKRSGHGAPVNSFLSPNVLKSKRGLCVWIRSISAASTQAKKPSRMKGRIYLHSLITRCDPGPGVERSFSQVPWKPARLWLLVLSSSRPLCFSCIDSRPVESLS